MSKRTEFKTAKGTPLPIMDLKGKEYLQVQWRLVWMREEHPLWRLDTRVVQLTDQVAIFSASITDENGNTLANAHKSQTKAGFANYIEKAETGAVGRVLAYCGYGTQFCGDELEEGDEIADAPAEPRAPARGPVVEKKQTESDNERAQLNRELIELHKPFMSKFPSPPFAEVLMAKYGVPETKLMSVPELKNLVGFIRTSLADDLPEPPKPKATRSVQKANAVNAAVKAVGGSVVTPKSQPVEGTV
jgi:hypothetical protein